VFTLANIYLISGIVAAQTTRLSELQSISIADMPVNIVMVTPKIFGE